MLLKTLNTFFDFDVVEECFTDPLPSLYENYPWCHLGQDWLSLSGGSWAQSFQNDPPHKPHLKRHSTTSQLNLWWEHFDWQRSGERLSLKYTQNSLDLVSPLRHPLSCKRL